MRRSLEVVVGSTLVLVAAGTTLLAESVAVVPELNPASISGALAVAAGGFLLLRASRKRK
jgi:hypothetical protein